MEKNQLYPVFLKVTTLNTLIVGGGNVALEKLSFILKSSPAANVTLVAPFFRPETLEKAAEGLHVKVITAPYHVDYLKEAHVVIATTDNPTVNLEVYNDCKKAFKLVNLADNPPYCDFYMGGIVTKGNVKIAISTNGQSPTLAKRLRQFFEEILPDDIDKLAENLNKYRSTLKNDFQEKVDKMNAFTEQLVNKINKSDNNKNKDND